MLVSIGIPTYNRSGYLRRAIQSVLSQTDADIELIVSDDCSTDDTENVVRSFHDTRIRYCRSAVRLGVPRNWNVCVRQASGEFFGILPDDDEYRPAFVSTMAALLDSDPEIAFVQCAVSAIDEDSRDINAIRPSSIPSAIRGEDAIRWHLSTLVCLPVSLLFRRSLMLEMGLWREEYLDDWAFIVKLAYRHGFRYTPEVLSGNRSHAGQYCVQLKQSGRDGILDVINQLSDIFGFAVPVTPGLLSLRSREERRLSRVCVREAVRKWMRADWKDGVAFFRRAHQLYPLALVDPLVIGDLAGYLRRQLGQPARSLAGEHKPIAPGPERGNRKIAPGSS